MSDLSKSVVLSECHQPVVMHVRLQYICRVYSSLTTAHVFTDKSAKKVLYMQSLSTLLIALYKCVMSLCDLHVAIHFAFLFVHTDDVSVLLRAIQA